MGVCCFGFRDFGVGYQLKLKLDFFGMITDKNRIMIRQKHPDP